MSETQALSVIDKLIRMDREAPRKILVLGDPMRDIYIQGRLEECQEGCSKFVEVERTIVPGGAANASRSLQWWDVRTVLGTDNLGGVRKTRYMVGDRCYFRHDDDSIGFDLDLVRRECLIRLESWRFDAVLLSDYDKGLLTEDFIQEVILNCKLRNIPCVADAKRAPELYRGAILKGNGEWLKRYGWGSGQPDQLVVTYGEDYPVVNGRQLSDCLPTVTCTNHVGAGDCFAAHFTLALAYGLSLKESAAVAHSAGRVYVQHRYNEPPRPEQIRADMVG